MLALLIADLFLAGIISGGAAASVPQASVIADAGTVRETRNVGTFDSVDASGAYELVIDADEASNSVVVEAAPELAAKITTVVQGHTLKIQEQTAFFNYGTNRTVVTIGMRSLAALSQSGAVSSVVKDLHGGSFSLGLSGAGSAKLAGTAGTFRAVLDGAASVDAAALKARTVKLSVAGTGSAKVWASDTLTADVSGVGSVTYYGKPAHVHQSVAGIGSVRPAP